MNAIHNSIIINITFKLKNVLHSSTLAYIKAKVHIYDLNELHIRIRDFRPPIAITPGEKGVNGGVEQPHAQCIIFNPKTKPVRIIL